MEKIEQTSWGSICLPLLGISVTPMTAIETAIWATSNRKKSLLLNHNLHSAYLFQRDREFRDIYQRASRIIVDGIPILFAVSIRCRHAISTKYRVGSTDWIGSLADIQTSGKIVIYGASERSNRIAVKKLSDQLVVRGWSVYGINGYVPEQTAVNYINELGPTLVLIGMGMPRQERFLLHHWQELPTATYATVGGAIDYIAGQTKLAPRWLGKLGFEWAWRLLHDPRRLAYRYLIEPIQLFITLIAKGRNFK